MYRVKEGRKGRRTWRTSTRPGVKQQNVFSQPRFGDNDTDFHVTWRVQKSVFLRRSPFISCVCMKVHMTACTFVHERNSGGSTGVDFRESGYFRQIIGNFWMLQVEWMTVFSRHYPSTTSKVCVDILGVWSYVNSHTTAQTRVRTQWYRSIPAVSVIPTVSVNRGFDEQC